MDGWMGAMGWDGIRSSRIKSVTRVDPIEARVPGYLDP